MISAERIKQLIGPPCEECDTCQALSEYLVVMGRFTELRDWYAHARPYLLLLRNAIEKDYCPTIELGIHPTEAIKEINQLLKEVES